jgi:hypothetical protein
MPTTAWFFIAFGLFRVGSNTESVEFVGAFAERAAQIVKRSTVHTTTAWEVVDADVGLFEWLIDHPSAAAALWKDLGLTVGSVEVLSDGWSSRDPDGISIEFHRLHQSVGLRAYYCKATAPTGAIPRTVTVEIVLVHRLMFTAASDGVQPIDRLEAWVSAEGAALRLIMKLANGATTNAVVRSLRETKLYFALAAKIAERRPQWARAALIKRPGRFSAEEFSQFEDHLKRAAAARPNVPSQRSFSPLDLIQTSGTTPR